MKTTSSEDTLILVLFAGAFASIFAGLIGLDPIHNFFFGAGAMYLNWELQGRLWTWWRKTPKFMGFRYWIKLFWRTKVNYR